MKKVYILAFLGVLQFTSCDDQLDKLPQLLTLDNNYYRTEKEAFEAIVAAYDPLQYNFTTEVFHFRWFFGDFPGDDVIKGGSGPTDQPQLEDIGNFRATPGNIHLNADWTAQYQGIYRTNVVLKVVPPIAMDEQVKKHYLAEAKFLRAYYFFQLVTMYGGVPLVDRILEPNEFQMPRATAQETWAFIEANLKEAIPVLRQKSQQSSQEVGRATKGAAMSLLLKAYIFQKKWPEALAIGNEIINSNEYTLSANYPEIFTLKGENGPGSIFEIQRTSQGGGYWGNVNGANEGNLAVVYQLPRGRYGGWAFNIPQRSFTNAFEPNDPRLKASVWTIGDQLCDRGVLNKSDAGADHDFYAKKYFVCKSEHEFVNVGDPSMNGDPNDRMIRYADVLLLTAEAAFHTGNEGLARNFVNQVRARARRSAPNPSTVLTDITAAGPSLLEAIYQERRVELGLEGHRFFDLVRTGRAASVLANKGFVAGKHDLFPIPQRQIDLSGGSLSQNPGY